MTTKERIQPEVIPYLERMALVQRLWAQGAQPISVEEGKKLLEVFEDPNVLVFVDRHHNHTPTFRIFQKHKQQAEFCFSVPIRLLAERTYNEFVKHVVCPENQELLKFYQNQRPH